MFSGIVEETARVVNIVRDRGNYHFYLSCSFAENLKPDQSVCHNGVCLTVVEVDVLQKTYMVTAIQETIDKSNLGLLQVGDEVNVERSMTMDRLLDGHMVQGHVDQTAECISLTEADGSWYYTFQYDRLRGNITVEKGSISVNGVSLTVVDSRDDRFSVAIIPFTWQITNFHNIKPGTMVNLEFDIIGKYIQKIMAGYLENIKNNS
ncbi:MAG: riboflavin synthase [Bacteroidales bacterium]|nr:riboflavin synthase [Bacteroidales bacterium]